MISKELLSAVLDNDKVEHISLGSHEKFKMDFNDWKYKSAGFYGDNYITVTIAGNIYCFDIYELAHKCKEWAFDKGYYLTIYNDAIDIVLQTNCKLVENITDGSFKYSPMLVFKACEWILKEGN